MSGERLREAAPDMLTALQAVVRALDGRVHSYAALSALAMARDAIAKATGPAHEDRSSRVAGGAA